MTTDRLAREAADEPAAADRAELDGRAAAAGAHAAGPEAGEGAPDRSEGAPTETEGPDRRGGGAHEVSPASANAPAGPERQPAEGSATASGSPRPAAGGSAQSATVEALAAAVRAVESGERSAASFFTEQSRSGPAAPHGSGPGAPPPGGLPQDPASRPRGTAAGRTPSPEGSRVPRAAAGAGPVRSPAAAAEWSAHRGTVQEVLTAGGAPETLADAVLDVLGEQAAQALRDDPWQLLSVPRVRPEQADAFARALLGAESGPDDPRRAQALIHWLLERAALEGHTALEPAALSSALARRAVPDPEEALRTAIAEGGVLVFQDALDGDGSEAAPAVSGGVQEDEPPVRVLLGLDRYALAEESLADGLGRLVSTFSAESGPRSAPGAQSAAVAAAPSPQDWQSAAQAAPSPSAAELIRAVAGNGLVAHTGGEAARAEPAAVVAAARALGLRAYAAAHSEDGRQRVARLIDAATAGSPAPAGGQAPGADEPGGHGSGGDSAAVTVAGLLAGSEGPGRDAEGALALDLLAVLDAPQLDVETAAMLVESLPDGTRLVLSGDPGVLWSAGPGRVFADVLAARLCLQVASRTPDPGPIGELVSGIGVGELSQVASPGKEVVVVPVGDAGEAVHRTVQLVADSVPRAIGVPSEHTQVITPGHGGAAGTHALNAALKERLNPGPGRFSGFDPGDRVVHVPAPGRALPGTVVSADAEGLHLDCAGSAVLVSRDRVGDTVRHGWALTAHQAAGMRWPAVVVVLPGDAAGALNRAWVYTAFSRGERHLSVVHGADQALARAVAEVPVKDRTTRLRTLLETLPPPA